MEFAENLCSAEGLSNLRLETGDAFALPFEDETVDFVWPQYLLQWLKTPEVAVNEMRRVTRPGGVVPACLVKMFATKIYYMKLRALYEISTA